MKRLILIALLIFTGQFVEAKGGDTAYYRRPYYVGLTAAYHGFTRGVFSGSPDPYLASVSGSMSHVYWSSTFGAMFTFPFAKHWELELGVEGSYMEGWKREVTDIRYDIQYPWIVTSVDHAYTHAVGSSFNTRLQMGYEVFRKNNYGLVAGVEFWHTLIGDNTMANFNTGAFAVVIKGYISVSHGNGAIQVSGVAGNLQTKSSRYVGLRVGFCLKGMRIYRHKPQHYYVRTYED